MSRSANEVQNLAAKAARGAGAPPGQAAGFGRAALRHLLQDRPLGDLEAALDALPEGPIMDNPLALTRAIEGGGKAQLPDTALLCSYAETLPFACDITETSDGLDLHIDLANPAPRLPLRRLVLPEQTVTRWTTLAARTFVPESDASRLAGAGAGLTDND